MTTAISILQRLQQHRAWANEHLLAAAATLSDEQLRRSFEIGQGSVWRSLVHMYAAEYVWLETLLGDREALCPGDVRGQLPGNQLGEGGIQSFGDLREKWAALETRWRSYMAELAALSDGAKSLDELVERRGSTARGGRPYFLRRSDALLHVCLHTHYTLTQVVNMLRHLGVEKLPERMMIQLAWAEEAVG
jgi:uncharacterized damage-inducible protein DinB